MEKVEKDTSRSTVTECSPGTPPACQSLFSPNPASAEPRRRSSMGCAWRRAGAEWVETMSFVAQVAKGRRGEAGRRGKGIEQGGKRLKNARKCYPGNTRAPQKTRIEGWLCNRNHNEMRKMSDGHFGDKWSLPQLIPQTRQKRTRNNRGQTRLEGPQPRRPFYPL